MEHGREDRSLRTEKGNSRVIFLPGFIVHIFKAAKTLKVFNRVISMFVCVIEEDPKIYFLESELRRVKTEARSQPEGCFGGPESK